MFLRTLVLIIVVQLADADVTRCQENIDGVWTGAVIRQNAVQLVEIVFESEGDSVSGHYSVPSLGLYEEPLREVRVRDLSVHLRILYGPFELLRNMDSQELTGSNERWNPPLAMHLKKAGVMPDRNWTTSMVAITGQDDVQLWGTLYLPTATEPVPAVVVVPGSGEQDRSMWEYRSHAYELVKRGIGAFVYDKRGCGMSGGDWRKADFETLANDALDAVEAVSVLSSVKSGAVGLLGISQGGWLSAIASRKRPDVPFIVMLQGPATSLEEQEFDRVEYSLRFDGYSAAVIDSALELTRRYFDLVNEKGTWREFEVLREAAAHSEWRDYVQMPKTPDDPDITWWRTNAYDPADDLRSIQSPVLAIFGEEDVNVPAEENVSVMTGYLESAGVDYSIVTIPQLPHSVTTYNSLKGGAWDWPAAYWVWGKRPFMLDSAMASWVRKHTDH